MWMLQAHADAIPRLQAQESLRLAAAVAVGSGVLKRDDARAMVREWERQADGGRKRQPALKATPDDLQAMGVSYRVVPRRKKS
jgi:hypothetical protein